MKKNYLLPNKYKKIGLWMFIPFCILCFSGWESNFEIPVLAFRLGNLFSDGAIFEITKNDPVNEIGMLGFLISLCFIALSREKDEDEMTGQIRMQSFVWSFRVTAVVLALGILLVYDLDFLTFMFIAMFLVFILYIIKFNLTMISVRRENDEK